MERLKRDFKMSLFKILIKILKIINFYIAVYTNSSTMDPHLVEVKSSLPSCSSSMSSMSTSGLESLHGSSEEMSETSDYQRSTPSPRDQDDDLFMAHVINRNKNKTQNSKFHVSLTILGL